MVVGTKFNFPEGFFGANLGSTENLIFQKDLEGANVVVATKFNFPEGFFGANVGSRENSIFLKDFDIWENCSLNSAVLGEICENSWN